MSARNYTNCPRCRKRAAKRKDELCKLAASQYGQVSSEEYLKTLQEAHNTKAPEGTLGEYYEHDFMVNNSFVCRYSVYCSACGFEFEHTSVSQNVVKDE